MDFVWADEYDAMNGPNRKSRRIMEEENKKIRKKVRREYNETVRGLAEFVKKRDKRVIDMQIKRNEEIERKKEEERLRKKEIERLKKERAMAYEVPDWAKVEEDVESEVQEEVEVEDKRNEFYCVACGKKFKSDKQWKNHEQSKKHKEKVAELRDAFSEEDRENEDEEEEEEDGFVSVDEVEKLKEEFEGIEIRKEEKDDDDKSESDEEFVDVDDGEKEEDDNEDEDDDDEDSVLKAMLKKKENVGNTRKQKAPKNVYVEAEVAEVDLMEYMEYNNTKGRRKRG
nr:DnaJ protein JJJ1 homolog [Tanacetum cinerariifolium]